jgi:AmmeMemoRadiSam system protein A
MAPTSFIDKTMIITDTEKQQLLKLARQSIQAGLQTGKPLGVNSRDYPETLQQSAACFVTLTLDDQLRGCIGHLSAMQPLVADVVENAFSAAFSDPRFPALTQQELNKVAIEISVLTPAEKNVF